MTQHQVIDYSSVLTDVALLGVDGDEGVHGDALVYEGMGPQGTCEMPVSVRSRRLCTNPWQFLQEQRVTPQGHSTRCAVPCLCPAVSPSLGLGTTIWWAQTTLGQMCGL